MKTWIQELAIMVVQPISQQQFCDGVTSIWSKISFTRFQNWICGVKKLAIAEGKRNQSNEVMEEPLPVFHIVLLPAPTCTISPPTTFVTSKPECLLHWQLLCVTCHKRVCACVCVGVVVGGCGCSTVVMGLFGPGGSLKHHFN